MSQDETLREAGKLLRADPSQIPEFLATLGIVIPSPVNVKPRFYRVETYEAVFERYWIQEFDMETGDAIGEPVVGCEINNSSNVPVGYALMGWTVGEYVYFSAPFGTSAE